MQRPCLCSVTTRAQLRVSSRVPVRPRSSTALLRRPARRNELLQTVVVRANLGEGEPKDKGEAKEKERGFTEGKTWSWYFEQEPPEDGEANDVLIRQLSGLDKMLAIVMSEAALPGTIAVCLCYVFRVQPFALLELTPAAVATGALFALPTVLLDVYLLAVRPRQMIDARRGKDGGDASEAVDVGPPSPKMQKGTGNIENGNLEINYTYSISNAVDDYAGWARGDLPVLLTDTPIVALLPTLALSSAAQELLFRGFALSQLTFTLNSVFEQYFDGPLVDWNTEVAEKLSDAQLLDLPSPPLLYTAAAALFVSTVASLVFSSYFDSSYNAGGMDDDGNEMMTIEVEDLDSAVDNARAGRIEGWRAEDDDDKEGEEGESEVEQVELNVDVQTSPQDVDSYRTVAAVALRSLQWLATGNLVLPVVSCIVSDVAYLLLVKYCVPDNVPKSAVLRIGADDVEDDA